MPNFLLRVQWDNAIEYVEINTDAPPLFGDRIETAEYRSHTAETLNLRAICQSCEVDSRSIRFVLKYLPEENKSLAQKDIAWGISIISINLDQFTAKAEWVDDGSHPELNKTCQCTVIHQPVIEELLHESVLRISRPAQAKLRKLLLEIYGKCAFTGETTPEALEVAHITPVAKNGSHGTENAILLRADLHRLFDAGLLSISESGQANFHPSVSENYKQTFSTMCATALDRVQQALIQRTQNV